MIRVLQMIGSLNMGAAQDSIMNIYRKIDRTKIQFDFVLDHPKDTYFVEEAKSLGAKIHTMPAFNGTNAAEVKRDWNNFFYMHPEYKVLHCHVPGYASLYLPVAKKHGVKTIVHCYGISAGSGPMAMAQNALHYPLKKQADILMACSNEAGLWIYGEKAIKSDKFMLMPNAIDLDCYAPDEEKRSSIRKTMGFEAKFVVGHIGSFTPDKNHSFLLEAFAKLHMRKNNARLMLVGEGPLQREVAAKAVELGVAEDVFLTGKRNDIPELLSAMDVFVLPSESEPDTHIIAKAQASGLPCLISETIADSADISSLVKRLPSDSAESWAEAMLSAGGRQDVSEDFVKANIDAVSAAIALKKLYTGLHRDSNR